MDVFTLPRQTRALVTGVLLSAVKVERVEKQVGYKLYIYILHYILCISHSLCRKLKVITASSFKSFNVSHLSVSLSF